MAFGGLKKGKGRLHCDALFAQILTFADRNDLITWLKAETK